MTKAEINIESPGALEAWDTPEGWEDDEVVAERAVGALARIAQTVGDHGTALVVSHGGVIRILWEATNGVRLSAVPNVGGAWFSIGIGVFTGDEIVELIDDATVPDQI